MRTFYISTLGCKVNAYESEQLATLLRHRGLCQVDDPSLADLRIVNSCSVTIQAASKSRQTVRQLVRKSSSTEVQPCVVVAGCWATSDKQQAGQIPGVRAVITHHDDVAEELDRILSLSQQHDQQIEKHQIPSPPAKATSPLLTVPKTTAGHSHNDSPPEQSRDKGWIKVPDAPALQSSAFIKSPVQLTVKKNPIIFRRFSTIVREKNRGVLRGTATLPLLDAHQDSRQRGLLKIQDGCDAHCSYCIIPQLRPALWNKPVEDVVDEAKRLVDAGHLELVLTGIFLGAYGHETALRRRQNAANVSPLARLIDALCTRVPGLLRLRLSSLEPGDLGPDLIAALRSHPQVAPHFHLPLQSGSDAILRKMNRQYTRDDYMCMLERVYTAFDRPAITTDIIAGFPGETDQEFARTLEVVDAARFIHIHAFPFSPRPKTAAARWSRDFVRGPAVNERMQLLQQRAEQFSLQFREQFVGQTVQLLVENGPAGTIRHGRSERYFDVHFEDPSAQTGRPALVRIDRVTSTRTHGTRRPDLP